MKALPLAVAGSQLGLYHTSLLASLQPSTVSPACSIGTVELAAPFTTIAFVTNVTAPSAPTPSHSHDVIVVSDDSDESVNDALGDMEDTDGSVYELSSDEEDASEVASDISMSFRDDDFGSILGAVHQDAELSDDSAGYLSDFSVMSLEEETYFDSDAGEYTITPDTSQEAQLSDDDSALTYRRLRTSGTDNLCGVFAVVGSLDAQLGLRVSAEHARDIVRSEGFQERLAPFRFTLSAESVDEDIPNLRPGLSTQESADATSNLPVDQVALLLDIIGEESGRTFQLGVITPTSSHVYYRRDGATTVWIFNDDVAAESPGLMNHYEAVELLVQPSEESDRHRSSPQRPPQSSGNDPVAIRNAFDILMDVDDTGDRPSRPLPRHQQKKPLLGESFVAPVSVLERLKMHAAVSVPDDESSGPASVHKAQGKLILTFHGSKKGRRTNDDDAKTLWQCIMSDWQNELESPSLDAMFAAVAESLRPRLESAERGRPLTPFETSLAKVLRYLFTPENNMISTANTRYVAPDQAEDWARAISRYIPSTVQKMFVSGVPDLTQIPWIDTGDIGVYWIGLRPLMEDMEWYDYVGSATMQHRSLRRGLHDGGLYARRQHRYQPSALHSTPHHASTFRYHRSLRRQAFERHLHEIGSTQHIDHVDDLEWATLMRIPGSAEALDPRDATYFRWASLITEAAFHLWLGSMDKLAVDECSPWRASGAGPRRKCSFPPFDLRFCNKGNRKSPLQEGLRGVWGRHGQQRKRFLEQEALRNETPEERSERLRPIIKAAMIRNAKRIARETPEQRLRRLRLIRIAANRRYARMVARETPEEKAERLLRRNAYRRMKAARRWVSETPQERAVREARTDRKKAAIAAKRAAETPEEKAERHRHVRERDRRSRAIRHAAETPEEKAERVHKAREVDRKSRVKRVATETPQEKAERLRKKADTQRRRLAAKRAAETPQEKAERLRKNADNQRRRLAAKTPEEQAERRRKKSEQARRRLAAETPEEAAERRRKKSEQARRRRERK